MTTEIKKDYDNPKYYDNREVSWLGFNYRVLQEAADKRNPLLERLGFLAIGSSNLDEFMMVRVAGLQDQHYLGENIVDSKKQWTPDQQLDAIAEKNKENVVYQYELYDQVVAECRDQGIYFISIDQVHDEEQENIKQFYNESVFPTLTPLGVDAYRPFPNLNNKVLHLFVNLQREDEQQIAIVPIPPLVNRYYHYQCKNKHFLVPVEEIIQYHISGMFAGYTITSSFFFRVTRNADLDIHEEGAEDLLAVIEDYLIKRRNGRAVRLEVDIRSEDTDGLAHDIDYLMRQLDLEDRDLYLIDGPLDLTGLNAARDAVEAYYPELVFEKFSPVYPRELQGSDVFKASEHKDVFFHHPYDSFKPIVQFIADAANDPDTVAIKQTLYRVSNNSPIIHALKTAAEHGKQVTVLVELKARFDEENNVQWAKVLEEAGCHVIYGKTHLKTHSKIAMVMKQKNGKLTRYVHLGTGNYNDKTARIYTDMGVITTDEAIGQDATDFFNYLSGYSDQPHYKHLHVSPFDIRDTYMEDIDQEIEQHKEHGNGHIIAKMNSLTSKPVIKKLYEASQAGVKVDLIIRGICCLNPGIPGLSDNIRVISIVGRFLEHSRIYWFNNNGEEKLFLSSADMMTRNMIKRVEIEFPILDANIRSELKEILKIYLDDNTKARYKLPDSNYDYVTNDQAPVNAQMVFMAKAEAEKSSIRHAKQNSENWFSRIQNRILQRRRK
ncbi:RNA degradosome polyphosphate kinase [Aerococcus kribbianus]|uniref:Polyphosphate kinase n=1 Tax=Aerococcus kribbianus TaxID=2999064 RepID=A0A9X3FTS5_9LACT|nr:MULTISPECIES: RNA degradosome polyphosphate kinase [unclassified Aerococcus]MCZ0716726.1 RNA degradosome polyphosphate kinase [Aerococcus sp. YH-aer221]MCZ0725014.1 RNA degradosome polyphosphate kinase [Aerococcus sp. YH-aer222]